MTISLRLNSDDAKLIQSYAHIKNLSVSEAMRAAIMEQINQEFDLLAYNEGMEEFLANPITISHDEVMKKLNLTHVQS